MSSDVIFRSHDALSDVRHGDDVNNSNKSKCVKDDDVVLTTMSSARTLNDLLLLPPSQMAAML